MGHTRLHWNYFLALERDFEATSRYIEFCSDNLNCYSIEFAHLLLSASSEVDTLAKCICAIVKPDAKAGNIDDYRKIITDAEKNEILGFVKKDGKHPVAGEKYAHKLSDLKVCIPRYNLACVPWKSWGQEENPDWWRSYNKVKHERNRYFNQATLRNTLFALAALLAMNYVYCRVANSDPRHRYEYRRNTVTRYMVPHSTFLRFTRDFYDDPIAELGAYISSVAHDVDSLHNKE